MNFGHTAKSTDLDAKNADNFEAVDHSDSSKNSWEQTTPIERDERAIGSKAIRSPERIPNHNTEITSPSKFGEVVNLSMPPGSVDDSSNSEKFDPTSLNPNIIKFINPDTIKEEKGRLPVHMVKTMDQIIDKIDKGEIPLKEAPELRDDLSGEYTYGSFKRKTVLTKNKHKEAA